MRRKLSTCGASTPTRTPHRTICFFVGGMTQFLPTTLIAHTAHPLCAASILAHFGTATKALTPACALVVPGTVTPRFPG